jgi:hypothetical protein
MLVSTSGWAECAHFRMVYPIPLGPGVEVGEVVLRMLVTSLMILSHCWVGIGGGSSCWIVLTGCGFMGKNL